ncbi:Imm30 family immunity protein [Brevibacillus laterosporus]|uniref:Imm30 family immunity protein n=1 Tax=Brevibacillus halotolerans TaxID=1507437 RepID=A0ABT4HTW9_9BACL|nr:MULTISPECIES: Imm30 family immunity protein [Brevibacillus]MCR8984428.1 Imm30 family immunity protein [Brevibacillus laterosporus]MCZ0830152.1 Imm30 family immunity protein [Brevibacillus halotolerans]
MSFEKHIETLYKMRFLNNEGDDINLFTSLLNELAYNGNNEVIIDLCTIFEDDIEEPSAADDIIETIFYIANRNGLDEGLYVLAKGIPKMIPQAKGWAKTLLKTMMNGDRFINPFINALKKIDIVTKQDITEMLIEIKKGGYAKNSENIDKILAQIIE